MLENICTTIKRGADGVPLRDEEGALIHTLSYYDVYGRFKPSISTLPLYRMVYSPDSYRRMDFLFANLCIRFRIWARRAISALNRRQRAITNILQLGFPVINRTHTISL